MVPVNQSVSPIPERGTGKNVCVFEAVARTIRSFDMEAQTVDLGPNANSS
jgi:hypothetical protein